METLIAEAVPAPCLGHEQAEPARMLERAHFVRASAQG